MGPECPACSLGALVGELGAVTNTVAGEGQRSTSDVWSGVCERDTDGVMYTDVTDAGEEQRLFRL